MKSIIVDLLNSLIENDEQVFLRMVLSIVGRAGYVVVYGGNGRVVNVKKSPIKL